MPKKRTLVPAGSGPPAASLTTVGQPGPVRAGHKPGAIARLPESLTRAVIRYRWQETPVVAGGLVFWAGSGSGAGAALTGAAAGLLHYSRARGPIGGRQWLSERERQVAALWLAAASVWQLLVLVPFWDAPARWEMALLVVLLAFPSWRWWGCRRPPRPAKVSAVSGRRLAAWAVTVAARDGALKDSVIDRSTVLEPGPEVLSFEVELRDGVHNADAATDTSRKAIEAALGLPADCVQVTALRTRSARIKVVLAPVRTLETAVVGYPIREPVITGMGVMPISVTDDGTVIEIKKWGKDGVKHGRGCGNSGTGKSGVLRCLVRPGVERNVEAPWLIDGKRGTSVPEIAAVFDWYSTADAEWLQVILALEAVVMDRERRRGREGKSAWRTGTEADPNICLYIEECGEVAKIVGKRGAKAMLTILQHGRAVGASIYQTGQDPAGEFLVGGRPARELLAMGFEILGKPGGKLSRNLAQDSNDSQQKVNLLALPAGEGLEGFVAVLENGKVLASKSRVGYFTDDDARSWAAAQVERGLRTLGGADLVAAGEAYARRNAETFEPLVYTADVAEQLGDDGSGEGEQTEEEITAVQAWILKVLTVNKAGVTLAELTRKGDGQRSRSRRNISINLRTLRAADKVTVDGDTWRRVD